MGEHLPSIPDTLSSTPAPQNKSEVGARNVGRLCSFWRLSGENRFFALLAPKSSLHSLSREPFRLLPQFSHFSFLTLTLLPSYYMNPCDYSRALQIFQENFPISRP
jgi:hypothetical protein